MAGADGRAVTSEPEMVVDFSRPLLSVSVHGVPQPGGSKVASRFGGVRDANPRAKDWKLQVAQVAGEAWRQPLADYPVALVLEFTLVRPKSHRAKSGMLRSGAPRLPMGRPDALKLARTVEDALTGVVWRDDAQVVWETIVKRYGEPAGVSIKVLAVSAVDT